MIRELLWAMTALGGALIWFLSNTWEQGASIEDLLGQEMLWTVAELYALMLLVRIAFWTLRVAAKALR